MGRFDFVKYDQESLEKQVEFKVGVEHLEVKIEKLGKDVNGKVHKSDFDMMSTFSSMMRNKARALSALEDFYTYSGKAIRDEQLCRNGIVEKQEERVDG